MVAKLISKGNYGIFNHHLQITQYYIGIKKLIEFSFPSAKKSLSEVELTLARVMLNKNIRMDRL